MNEYPNILFTVQCIWGSKFSCYQNGPVPKLGVAQVWSGRFWMGIFGSLSPKPHIMYSNDEGLITMLCEKVGFMNREQQQACPVRTAKTYYDKKGVKRSVGRKKELRESQSLD